MLTIILGSAIGFFCSLSLILAVGLLIAYKQKRKQIKMLEDVSNEQLRVLLKGDRK